MKSSHGNKLGANGKPKPNTGGVQKKGNRGKQKREVKEAPKATNTGTKQTSALDRLTKLSSTQLPHISQSAEYFVKILFPHPRLLCVGNGYWCCESEFLANFRKPLSKVGVIVPAYMTNRSGQKARSVMGDHHKRSKRTNDNTGTPRFVVFASARGTLDEQADSILKLRSLAPLKMVVRSHSERIEAWFSTTGLSVVQIKKLRQNARSLGAPQSIFYDCQPYAMPCGWNYRCSCNQPVVFWNPSVK